VKKAFLNRGQSLVDLALIIGVVGLVFIGMQTYIKRGVQGRVRDLANYILSEKQDGGDAAGQITTTTSDSWMIETSQEAGKTQ
jgi:hypothetical protein